MNYQPKTTLVSIHTDWEGDTLNDVSIDALYDIQGDLAIIIAERCQMDIMSMSCALHLDPKTGFTSIVYVNNGRSLKEILAMIEPEEDITHRYWQVVTVAREHGGIQVHVYIAK